MVSKLYIDLFSGCGGLSQGLGNAGWHGLFAIEKSSMAFDTFQHNLLSQSGHFHWPDWLPKTARDINEVLKQNPEELKKLSKSVHLVAGGPPCQGFSMAGKRNRSDTRNNLVHSYLDFVGLVKPQVIFFENVAGITRRFRGAKGQFEQNYSQIVEAEVRNLGYKYCYSKILNLADYGIPQSRRRFIMVAFLNKPSGDFFEMLNERRVDFLKSKGLGKRIGVQAALSDLLKSNGIGDCPDGGAFESGKYGKATNGFQKLMRQGNRAGTIANSHRFPNHFPQTVEVFENLLELAPKNVGLRGDIAKQYGVKKRNVTVLDPKKPSPTILSIPDDYVHYCEARIMTVRECARLQTFPDNFEFLGKYTSGGKMRAVEVPRYTQVGNAIPPLFAELAGQVLMEMTV